LNQLYKHTQLQDTFGVINLALVNGEPKVLTLKDILVNYLIHQEDVVTRRTKYDLNKAEERAHILEGLLIALDNIDEVIRIIRASETVQKAKEELIKRFGLTDAQAQAIVDMRLRALTGLERGKIEAEYKELMERIANLREILADKNKLLSVIKKELEEVSAKYGDERRTKFGFDEHDISVEDMIPDEPVIVTATQLGYIKRMTVDNFRNQNRGGRGIKGMQTIEDDAVADVMMTMSHDTLLFFTNKGRAYRLKAYELPEASRTARGTALVNLLMLQPDEHVTTVIPIRDFHKEHMYLVMATKEGLIKRTELSAFANVRKTGIIAITLREGDELIEVKFTDGNQDIFMVSKKGMCIRFHEDDVRPTGRSSMGVRGMNIEKDDIVVSMQLAVQGDFLLIISEKGLGKRTKKDEFKAQSRGGKGVKCYKTTERTGDLVGAKMVIEENEVLLITTEGIMIRTSVDMISVLGRNTSGVKVMNLEEGIKVASFTKVKNDDSQSEENSSESETEEQPEDASESQTEEESESILSETEKDDSSDDTVE
jgi:DNA gyrase subunit A